MKWRRLRTLLRREVQATFRDPFTVSILIAVPLAALMLFGFVLSTEVKHMALDVLDANGTSASRRLVAELAAGGSFDPRPVANRETLEHDLVSGGASVGLVIPPDFDRQTGRAGAPTVQVLYDGAEAILAGNAEAFLRTLMTATAASLRGRNGPLAGGERRDGIEVVARPVFNAHLDGKPFMVAGTFGFVLSFLTVLITAVSIVNERITGTFDQLQVTPATALEILLGKLLPLGAMFAFDVVLMMVVAGVVLGVWPTGSPLFFFAVSVLYVLISLAMGLIISATSSTPAEAVQKTVLLSVPLVQLSGFAFPTRSMPLVVSWLTEIFPATHYIRISRAIYLRSAGPLAMLPEIALLVVFGVLLMVFALRTIEARA